MARSTTVTNYQPKGAFLNAFGFPKKIGKVASILDRATAFKSAKAQQATPHRASYKVLAQPESRTSIHTSRAAKSEVFHQGRRQGRSFGNRDADGLDRAKKAGSLKPTPQKTAIDTDSSDNEPLMVKSNRRKLSQNHLKEDKKTPASTTQLFKDPIKPLLTNDETTSVILPSQRKSRHSARRIISDDEDDDEPYKVVSKRRKNRRIISDDEEDDEPYKIVPKRRDNRRIIHEDDSDDEAVLRATPEIIRRATLTSDMKESKPIPTATKSKETTAIRSDHNANTAVKRKRSAESMAEEKARLKALAEKTRLDRQQERWNALKINEDRAARRAEVASYEASSKRKRSADSADEMVPSKKVRQDDQSASTNAAKAQGQVGNRRKDVSKIDNTSASAVHLGFFTNLTKNWSSTASSSISSSASISAPKRKADKDHNPTEPSSKRIKMTDFAEESRSREGPRTPRRYRQARQSGNRNTSQGIERRPLRPVQSRLVQGIVLEDGEIVNSRDLEAARSFYRR